MGSFLAQAVGRYDRALRRRIDMGRSVHPSQTALGQLYYRLPLRLRAPQVYWDTLRLLQDSQSWDENRIREYQVKQLKQMLLHCAANVPYYRELFHKIGFDPSQFSHLEQLEQIPPLELETVRTRQQDLLATNIPPSRRLYFTTGGTLGRPLGLYSLIESRWRELAFIETMWARVGFSRNDQRAILGGAVIRHRKHWCYTAKERGVLFSIFHLTPATALEYCKIMKEKKLAFFHCYPSAAIDFAKCLQTAGGEPPQFRVLLLASENLYPGQREFAEAYYGCRIFTFMGHSENTVLAGGCEVSNDYHVFPEYGYVEVLDGDRTVVEEGQQGEMIGTSLYNTVMPLIRYRTGDWANIGPKRCACGRKHQLYSSILGRRDQEMLVGRIGNRMSITAINMHSKLFDNVEHFQFYQRQPGRAELRIVRAPNYTDQDSQIIMSELKNKIGDTIDLELKFVDSIELTGRGKFRYILQDFDNIQTG